MKLKDIRIGPKLLAAFLTVALFVLSVGLFGYRGTSQVAGFLKNVSDERLPGIQTIGRMIEGQMGILMTERTMLLASTPREIAFQQKRADNFKQVYDDNRANYERLPQTGEEKALWQEYRGNWERFLAAHQEVVELLRRGEQQRAIAHSQGSVRQVYLKCEDQLEKIMDLDRTLGDQYAKKAEEQARQATLLTFVAMVIGTLLALAYGLFVPRSLSVPLMQGVAFAERMHKGDLTARIELDRKDEIGILANALNEMAQNLGGILRELNENSSTLNSAAAELSAVSEQLTGNSQGMSDKTSSVASAAEEMSSSIVSVSAAAEQSSSNANVVATATEEMNASVGEIAQNANKARVVTTEAVSSINDAEARMDELGKAAQEISHVIEVIREIAEQTKLLALNATIEAARAGEAGKGFTVVANEVKELAKQTNEATEDIRLKIESMQGTTSRAIEEISAINQVIHTVDEIINSIASSVEEQSITTREISSNIGQAAQGIRDVSAGVLQAATAANGVAQDISVVHSASTEVMAASTQVHASAQELSRMGGTLHQMVSRFQL